MLKQHGGNSRFVWNKLLEYSQQVKKDTDIYPGQSSLQKQILQIKAENDFIHVSHSQPIQVNALRMNNAYSRAFKPEVVAERNKKIAIAHFILDEEKRNKELAKTMNFGFPKFKSKNRSSDSIFYPQNFLIKKSRIHFPKLGWISYIKHRAIEGKPKFVTITQDGSQYYVSVTCEIDEKEQIKVALDQANIVGIDVGLKVFATLSDGSSIKNPGTLKKHLKRLRKESRSLSRKVNLETGEKTVYGKAISKSSSNREKQVLQIQKLHGKVKNVRKNFLHNVTHRIIAKYDGVVLENLDISGMLNKNGKAMNRSMSDVSWYEFGRQLEYKSAWHAKHFCKVNRYFPSTQLCCKCGSKANLSLKDRVYSCQNCGAVSDRDLNASINIKDEGLRILNTVATTGIQACGSTAVAVGQKQEKRRLRVPATAVA